ncbi:hypothetical protein NP570_25425, partial [Vibrio parahaemolyticus]|nr:hypothetical protein [Vibrio parahaemolyticus]
PAQAFTIPRPRQITINAIEDTVNINAIKFFFAFILLMFISAPQNYSFLIFSTFLVPPTA